MTYDEALAFLHSLQMFGFQPGLETTRHLAALAGNPHDRLRFIHVAGTNGKGSTCALLESVYRAAGFKVGLYTSPHLVRFGERIQVNRVPIGDAELAHHVAELKDLAAGMEPTFFEFTTVVALRHFAEQKVDLVIWETGLGGRLDATNIVTPLASVITNIALDHQRVLGTTPAAIASEKAGIIKPGVPVLTATEDSDARAIIAFKARELDAPLITIGEMERANFRFEIPLLGEHQRTNGALAAATVRLLRFLLPVSDEQLRSGLAHVSWPGRLQVVTRGPQTLLLDGAHNPAGIAALQAALAEHFPGRRPTLVIGMLADKDWRAMVAALVPLASRVVTAPVASERTVRAEELRAACVATGAGRPAKAAGSVAEALKLVAPDPFVLVTGSLYFLGEVMEHLGLATAHGNERTLNEWSPPKA
ncbi:MAG TPA: folylpolyglutamate synthase/dihydrofolate synthase family protein [Candidatus Limnocylindria bacterium]|nr:folylpolyglutamate synthase/dihydrofolate synthase family protein [Candidatus Limnocylindria bacterium]